MRVCKVKYLSIVRSSADNFLHSSILKASPKIQLPNITATLWVLSLGNILDPAFLIYIFQNPTIGARLPMLDNYTDHELEHPLDSDVISPELLDTIIVTFIYVEKLRREREQAWKKDIRWNY